MLADLVNEARHLYSDACDYAFDRRRCAALLRELDACGPQERREFLARYGLTRLEFEEAIRIPFASEDLATSALQALSIDADALYQQDPDGCSTIRRNCTLCQAKYRCKRDLARDRFAANHPDYCPNSLRFSELSAQAGPVG